MKYEMYSKDVMKHFLHPVSMGKIENPSGIGNAGNMICGDSMQLFIKVREDKKTKKKIISDIKFQTFGCVVAIANSSMITTMAKGRTIEEALKITKDDVLRKLGKIPQIKVHCSILAIDALQEAIYDYMEKNNLHVPKKLEKVHERISKGMDDLEHKHEEYLRFEKEVYRRKMKK